MDDEEVLATAVDGVTLTKKRVIRDNRGAVLHMLKQGSPNYDDDFGELYFSKVKFHVIKGWKLHKEYTQRIVVPSGRVRFIIFDNREKSMSYGKNVIVDLSEENYCLLTIPPRLVYGFMGLSTEEALLANCSDGVFRTGESLSFSLEEPEYTELRYLLGSV